MMRTPDYYTRASRSAAGMLGQAKAAAAAAAGEARSGSLSRMSRRLPNDYYTRNM